MFSSTCQYAIRALVCLALHEGPRPVLARDIAAAEDIPKQFLAKILHNLRNQGLVSSQKGPGGGFLLARPPSEITLAEITQAVEGREDRSKECILGLAECSDEAGCPLHDAWKRFRLQYDMAIGTLTLSQMADNVVLKRNARNARGGGGAFPILS